MNVPPDDGVRVMPEELREFARQVFEKVGLPAADTAALVDTLIASDQRGVLSHGTLQMRRYVGQFRSGELNPTPQVQVVRESPATALVDGDGGLGHFAAYRATEIALAKAKELGTAAVVTRNHGHIGAAGTYTRLALPEGCAALCVSGVDQRSHLPWRQGPPHILSVGAGGPISFAVPAGGEPPLVLDMGCYISRLHGNLDEIFTQVPDAVLKILGLSAITMTLGGLLAGVRQPADPADRRWPGANQGSFIAVFDLARFMPLEEFQAEMEEYVRSAQAMVPLPGCERAELPGGPEWRHERDWATEGIPIGARHRSSLREVAESCVVALPPALAAAMPAWSPLAPFSGEKATGSPGGTHPIAVEGKNVHAVWHEAGRVLYRRSGDGGVTWSDPAPLTEGGTALYPCSLERTGDALHLFWPDNRNGGWEVYTRRSTDGGDTWGPEARLTPGVDLFRLGTAVSGDNIHVIWGTKSLVVPTPGGTHTWGEIYTKRSTDGGLTWEPTVRLTEPDNTAMRPSIAASGDFVYAAWFDRRDTEQGWDWEIYTKRSTDGGATWDPDVRVTNTRTHARHPEIVALPEGRVLLIWEDGQLFDGTRWGGDPALYAASSRDNGLTWRWARRITHINAPNGFATHPKTHACGSRIHLAWTDSPDGQDQPPSSYYMTSPDGGRTWEGPERLTTLADDGLRVEAVGGSDSCALVLIGRPGALFYRRRDM